MTIRHNAQDAGSFSPSEDFEFIGYHGCSSRCGLTLLECDGDLLVILSELPDNPGTSVTNSAAIIANALRGRREIVRRHPVGKVYFVEHTWRSHTGEADTWDLVMFHWDSGTQRYSNPKWRHLKNLDLESGPVEVLAAARAASTSASFAGTDMPAHPTIQ